MRYRNVLLCIGTGLILLSAFLVLRSFNAAGERSDERAMSSSAGSKRVGGDESASRKAGRQELRASSLPAVRPRMNSGEPSSYVERLEIFGEGEGHSSRRRRGAEGHAVRQTGFRKGSAAPGESPSGNYSPENHVEVAEPAAFFHPVVMRITDEALSEAGEEEQEVIRELQQLFAEQMEASPVPDAADPAYLDYWRKIQRGIDDRLRVRLGHEGFLRANILAAQQMASAAR